MKSALKAEFRKLLSVRSTYFISLFALGLLTFISLYVESYQNGAANVAAGGSLFLASSINQHSGILAVFGSIVALLLLAHEYRYGTIVYTLTANRSRSKVLLAKILVVFTYILVLTVVGVLLGLWLMTVGLHWAGVTMPHQNLSMVDYFGKALFYTEGYALAALLIVALVRNQVAALVIFFIEPGTFEGLMGLLLKHNSVYMPFTALGQMIIPPVKEVGRHRPVIPDVGSLSPGKAALVFGAYLIGGWLIAWYLFVKHDAN